MISRWTGYQKLKFNPVKSHLTYRRLEQKIGPGFRRANKHIIQHFLYSTEFAGISDKIDRWMISKIDRRKNEVQFLQREKTRE